MGGVNSFLYMFFSVAAGRSRAVEVTWGPMPYRPRPILLALPFDECVDLFSFFSPDLILFDEGARLAGRWRAVDGW